MVPPIPPHKAAWQWAESTKPEDVALNHVLTAYKMNLNFCNACRRNVKGNPCCLSGLGEKPWLSDVPPENINDLLREKNSYVGLKNLGATCYANAFLQVWFHMPEVRNAVFSWNTKYLDIEIYSPICEIISCLQEVFGLLYFSKRKFIDPTILLNCLLLDNTVQQDAQEFSKLFMAKLEELPSDGRSIFHDFVGQYDYVTSCTSCGNQTRSRSEFYELDLNVVNNKKLSSCLDEFLQQETLDGDNQFFCSTCNMKQNATRCIELVQLPAILNLQLLRFVYDKEKHSKKKVSSPLTFPDTLDMSPYVRGNSNSCVASSDEDHIYDLFAILIHSGQLASSGHYIAVIRDNKSGTTFQFNDEKVVKLEGDLSGYDLDNAIEEDTLMSDDNNNPTCTSNNNKTKKLKTNKEMSLVNAYMLVYRKRNETASVFEDIKFEELSSDLKNKILRHNEELNEDLSIESQKKEMFNQKEESIQLLYSTIMSYEGCGAEVKLNKFEFVPTQNLVKFLQVTEVGNNQTSSVVKINKKDDAMETNPDNDDPSYDNDVPAIDYNDDKEDGRFFCKHKKLNPDEVMNLKLLPSNVVDLIAGQMGLLSRLPCSEVLCKECVVKRCADINAKMTLSADNRKIISLIKSKQYQPTGFLIGKESWKNWRKKAEKNLFLESDDINETDLLTEMTDDASSVQSFNSDLLCSHDQLDPNEQNWKVVSSDVWLILKKYFPSAPEFPCGASCCATCEDKSYQEQIVQVESKQQALLLKQLLNDLFLNRKRPALLTLRNYQQHLNGSQLQQFQTSSENKANIQVPIVSSQEAVVIHLTDDTSKLDSNHPDSRLQVEDLKSREEANQVPQVLRYYLVSSVFIEKWKKCCKDSSKHEMPASICNRILVCSHDKLLFDPWDSEHSAEIARQFVLLWPEEWRVLRNHFIVDQEIYVEIAEIKSSGSYVAISIPELCVDCLEERRKEEMQSRFHYEKAKIYVYRLDSFDSDSSQQDILSINNINNNSNNNNNSGFEEKSKKRKSDEDIQVSGEKYSRLECCAAVRRSGRRSKNRGEKEILVNSNMTLRQLNFEIFRLFQVYKTNQVLYMDGRELVGDDCTLGELCVPPDALVKLEVHEDLEENFASHIVGGSIIEEGFKGTGLVG